MYIFAPRHAGSITHLCMSASRDFLMLSLLCYNVDWGVSPALASVRFVFFLFLPSFYLSVCPVFLTCFNFKLSSKLM